jgi:hypothetical protein
MLMKKIILFFIVFGICLMGFLAWKKYHSNQSKKILPTPTSQTPPQEKFFSINGKLVDVSISQTRPLAVVVENHPDARPQAGLSEADVVYETVAEGGITRFLALYQTQETTAIGPVRSARTYFAKLANDWQAIFAHVGGNSDVLANIKNQKYPEILDVDEFFHAKTFQRVKNREMPHNTYTSVKRLKSLAENLKVQDWMGNSHWIFKSEAPVSELVIQRLNIDFSQASYAVSWQYQPQTNSYLRTIAKQVDRDENNQQPIEAKNILVQYVKTVPTETDTIGSLDMELNTQGEAVVFLDGKVINGKWQYQNQQTKFLTLENQEIALNPGVVWVEMVPEERKALVTWY